MFKARDIVYCTTGKYKDRWVELIGTKPCHRPLLWICRVKTDQTIIALCETEMETIQQHDMRKQNL